MVGADKPTDLWRHPQSQIFYFGSSAESHFMICFLCLPACVLVRGGSVDCGSTHNKHNNFNETTMEELGRVSDL